MAGLQGTPSEKAFFLKNPKALLDGVYKRATARTAQREHTAMKLKPNNQTPHA